MVRIDTSEWTRSGIPLERTSIERGCEFWSKTLWPEAATQTKWTCTTVIDLERYNVIWTTPSNDSLDSMPLSGRNGAGANVWIQDGSIWIYLAHSGAYDEEARLLKLGCVRITPGGVDLCSAGELRQELRLAEGTIVVSAGDFRATLWFAGELLYVETESECACPLDVAFGTWRDRARTGLSLDMWNTSQTLSPDEVEVDGQTICCWHRNAAYSHAFSTAARKQGFEPSVVPDVIGNRTFGVAISIASPERAAVDCGRVQWQAWDGTAWTRRLASLRRHVIAIRLVAGRSVDIASCVGEVRAALDSSAIESARIAERARWDEFWNRSHVFINSNASERDPGFRVGQNYQLFRYMLACNRDGELPLLFNGGIFTVDNHVGRIMGNNNDELPIDTRGPSTPDFRRWMFCGFMSQNQRWLGWPTLAAGDVDLLAPSLRFYRERSMLAAARARIHGAEGVVYPEPMNVCGLCCVHPRPDGLCGAEHLTFHFSMMLEHAWMGLLANETLGVDIDRDVGWMIGTVLFYDSFYRDQARLRTGSELGPDGKLVIYPANGLEYAVDATDPIEVVAGLRRVTEALLRLPDLSTSQRVRLHAILVAVPALPMGEREGKRSLLPARTVGKVYNRWEPIEHYAAWPYRLVGVTQPETLQLARDTWDTIPSERAILCKQDYSWMANVVNMAACGWTDEAKRRAIYKLGNVDAPQSRFPAFFGPGHDWLPDHNWGGAGMTGIQEMLLAPEPRPDGKLYLLPAWPREWDVRFKLHAPGQTIIEAEVHSGKLKSLVVTPEIRMKDVVVCGPFTGP